MQEFLSRSLNRKNITRGFVFFGLCTVIGLCASFLWSGTQDIGTHILSMRGEFILLAALCMLTDWLFGGMRIHIFCRKMTTGLTFFDSIRANLSTICIGGITPFQTGGVGHIYICSRVGVPVAGCITAGIISFTGTLMFLFLAAAYVAIHAPDFVPSGITHVSRYTLLMFSLFLSFFLLMVVKPKVFLIPLTLIRFPDRRGFHLVTNLLNSLVTTLERLITEHATYTRMFITHHKAVCFIGFLCTAGIYASRFTGGYVIVRALGGDAPFWHVIAIQSILHFVTLFAPSPGASGIAEVLTVIFMGNLLVGHTGGLYSLLTRFFTTYCGVVVGGIVVISQLAKDLDWQSDKGSQTKKPIDTSS